MGFIRSMKQTIIRERMLTHGDTVLVAVSGGPDSTALLHALCRIRGEWGLRLIAAHINHGFRGRESDDEAEVVASIAREWDVPLEFTRIDVPAYIQATSMNPQEAARKMRYAYFYQLAGKWQANKIALGHHADDQAETVVMRFLRGAGPGSLAGMPVKRQVKNLELIRPLIRIYKAEILQYCSEWNIMYCTDSSNAEPKYTRNRIRLELMPDLRSFNPQLTEHLGQLSDMLREEDDYLSRETARLFQRIVKREGRRFSLEQADFTALHTALQRRLIHLILNCLLPESSERSYDQVERVRQAALRSDRASLQVMLPHSCRFDKEYSRLIFGHPDEELALTESTVIAKLPYRLELPELAYVLLFSEVSAHPDMARNARDDEVWFDLDVLAWPLNVRKRKAGDRISLWGLGGSKKLKDLMIDAKIPPSLRRRLPVVTDHTGTILWIPGLRRSDVAPLTEGTRHCLHIQSVPFI